MKLIISSTLLFCTVFLSAQDQNFTTKKIKNYLPHMTRPEVQELLTKTDLVIIPVAALEQHGLHLPIGTDFLNGVATANMIAQERDVLVAPILMAGQSPYHMGFEGTITLSAETIIKVHLEAVESLIQHGFKRFIIYNSHGGNRAISTLLVDQINQTTAGVAVNMSQAIGPFREPSGVPRTTVFDRHGGVSETSRSLFLNEVLVDLESAEPAQLTLPQHMQDMLPEVVEGDQTALMIFLAEGLKQESTGKKTSSEEMSTTGVWGLRDPKEATVEQGKLETMSTVNAAIKFIDRWNELRPSGTK
ncbi:MAG: creatininase family protein [Cyclobacteriaceae bacterium]